jgi:branched-chain amino acid transport system substrate-binding protein
MVSLLLAACSSSTSGTRTPAGATGATGGAGSATTTGSSGGSAASNTPGVTSDSIKLSVLGQFSGAAGPILNAWYNSSDVVWADTVNAQGGINGRKIQLVKIDTMDTPEGGVAACKQVQGNGSFAAMVVEGVNGHIPAIQCLNRANIPVLFNYPDPRLTANLKNAFSVAPAFDDQKGQVLVNFIKNYLHRGSDKIGVLYRSDSAVYTATGTDFVKTAKANGLNIVDVETDTASQSSYTSELLHLKNAGAQMVLVAGDLEIFNAIPESKAISYAPYWLTPGSWANDSTTNAFGAALKGLTELNPLVGHNSPAYATYAAAAQKVGQKPIRDSLYFYLYAVVMGKTLEMAGRNLTRQGWIQAVESLKNFDPQVGPPISYSATNHNGTDALFPVKCCDAQNNWMSVGPASTFSS